MDEMKGARFVLVAATLFLFGCGDFASHANPNTKPDTNDQLVAGAERAEFVVDLRQLEIPRREHGYSNFDTCLLESEPDFDAFLATLNDQAGWNRRDDVVAALTAAEIDFTKASLLLVRQTEGSGSVRVWLEPAVVRDEELVLSVGREFPYSGTSDMAYYCFALVVPNGIAERVRISGSFTPARLVIDDEGNEVMRDSSEADIVIDLP